MTGYARPPIPHLVFRDAESQAISYGQRWQATPPPAQLFSKTTHPQRFRSLHTVARSLIAYLNETYDVELADGVEYADPGLRSRIEVLRAVRIVPNRPDSAPMTFAFTSFPGVVVTAGAVFEDRYPLCGCDACDESVEHVAAEMEWKVLAIAAGNLSEIPAERPDGPVVEASIASVDGSQWTSEDHALADIAPERAKVVLSALSALPGGNWTPWPGR